jgi:hypothetical protein
MRNVIPAKAGIQCFQSRQRRDWMPDQVRHDEKGAFIDRH